MIMNPDLMLLFHNDRKMFDLFMTNPLVNSVVRFCEQNQFSTQQTLVEIIKVLAEQNENLQNQVKDMTLNSCIPPVFK